MPRLERRRLPAIPPAHIKGEPIHQTCTLFTRLPREIRNMIWTHALVPPEAPVVHVAMWPDGPRHRRCPPPSDVYLSCSFRCLNYLSGKQSKYCESNFRQTEYSSGVRVLRTCQAAYFECLPILWEKTEFHFRLPKPTLWLLKGALSGHAALIRTLSVQQVFPSLPVQTVGHLFFRTRDKWIRLWEYASVTMSSYVW